MATGTAWAISGTYLESCNCDAICPCRRIGGVAGGRSTHGICLGALSWMIGAGHAGEVDLAGLGAVLLLRYSDDEPGSPWTYVLFVDERADPSQHAGLADIFTGRLGGPPCVQFPWAYKASHLREVRSARIEIDHTPGRGWFRAGDSVSVRVREPVPEQVSVTCVIPGHHRTGREVYVDALKASDEEPLAFEFAGVCGYESTFAYSSDD